jgi:glutaredoxin 3
LQLLHHPLPPSMIFTPRSLISQQLKSRTSAPLNSRQFSSYITLRSPARLLSHSTRTINRPTLTPTTATISLSNIFRSIFGQRTMATAAAKTKTESIINDNPVAVFSKSYCPYCKASKELLTSLGAKFYAIELDQVEDGSEIQAVLKDISNQGTVPNIFIDGKHIGGNSDLQAQKKDLPELLKQAKAL